MKPSHKRRVYDGVLAGEQMGEALIECLRIMYDDDIAYRVMHSIAYTLKSAIDKGKGGKE